MPLIASELAINSLVISQPSPYLKVKGHNIDRMKAQALFE